MQRGPALWARIDRPDRANACGPEVIDGLHAWLGGAHAPGLRALVLTGTGTAFCAGADMRAGAAALADPASVLAYIRRGRELADAIAAAPLPVIAAVNGVALAGGFELVLAADVVFAARSARLGDAHARHAIVPGWGSSARLPRLVGRRAATRLLLTGESVSAEEMARLGVVTEVVDDDRLEAAVTEFVERLPADPETLARLVRLARTGGTGTVEEALDREWATLAEHVQGPAFTAGVQRFLAH